MERLTAIRTLPASKLAVGMRVICAMPEAGLSDTELVAAFDCYLEAEAVLLEARVMDQPIEYGYTPEDVAVRLLAPVSWIVKDDLSVRLVLGGGTDMNYAVRLTPRTRVRVIEAASA